MITEWQWLLLILLGMIGFLFWFGATSFDKQFIYYIIAFLIIFIL